MLNVDSALHLVDQGASLLCESPLQLPLKVCEAKRDSLSFVLPVQPDSQGNLERPFLVRIEFQRNNENASAFRIPLRETRGLRPVNGTVLEVAHHDVGGLTHPLQSAVV